MPSKTIRVDYLARVEGEGALYLRIRNDRVTDVQLKIFEPPRFFEAFLRGRDYTEAPDKNRDQRSVGPYFTFVGCCSISRLASPCRWAFRPRQFAGRPIYPG